MRDSVHVTTHSVWSYELTSLGHGIPDSWFVLVLELGISLEKGKMQIW